ncbi:MAG: metallophosphoesterase [Bacillota bacterium]
MNKIKALLYYMAGRVPIDNKNILKGSTLLHISDTPASFFGELARLIKILQPDFIVHTGDMVDNIKLELFPGSLWRYEREVKRLIYMLEQSEAERIYIALGNHDNEEIVRRYSNRSHIITSAETVKIEDIKFCIAHYPDEVLSQPGEINLYGHNLSLKSGYSEGRLCLNGITGINLIELNTRKYHSFPYPLGTDDQRLCRSKIGL